jgi:hypothetical protein
LKHKNSTIFALSKDGRGEKPTQRGDGENLSKAFTEKLLLFLFSR